MNLRRLQGTQKIAESALICSVGDMSVRRMSATQSGGCNGLTVVSKVVYVFFVGFCLSFIDFVYIICVFDLFV